MPFPNVDQGNLFSQSNTPSVLVLLGAPDLAVGYVERAAETSHGLPQWGLLPPPVDPIRCEARFQAAAVKLQLNDPRRAQVCGA